MVVDTDAPLPAGTFQLVDPVAWTLLEAAEDPFVDHRPADPACEASALEVEDDYLEIDTELCGYASAQQPSLAAVAAGETVTTLLYHNALSAPEVAEAHAAVTFGGELLWERYIPIPSGAEVYTIETPVPADRPIGTPLVFHLHNHGANTWNLVYVEVER